MTRIVGIVGSVLAMALFGTGVYLGLSAIKSRPTQAAQTPTQSRISLPGVLYVAQGGKLYRLQDRAFAELNPGPGSWSQPTLTADGKSLLAVSRGQQSSDLYQLDLDGHVQRQLTHDVGRAIDANHWIYYPHVGPDGTTLFYSYDSPKAGFKVDFAIWQVPLGESLSNAHRLTTPNDYTGGDVSPIPLKSGGLLYAKYAIDQKDGVYSQIWLQTRALSAGRALTQPSDGCGQPALLPDETRLAMVCTGGKQTSRLELAAFDGQSIAAPAVMAEGQAYAAPSWSPDGSSLVYFAPASTQGPFQLWTVAGSAGAKPEQVTNGLSLDSTSPAAWR